eukprot:822252-Rhodomonas_salina.1
MSSLFRALFAARRHHDAYPYYLHGRAGISGMVTVLAWCSQLLAGEEHPEFATLRKLWKMKEFVVESAASL